MANLQGEHVPDALHQRLRRSAQGHKCTLSDIVLSAIEHELGRREWHERLAERPVAELGDSAASLLAEERQGRRHARVTRYVIDASAAEHLLRTPLGPKRGALHEGAFLLAPVPGITVQNIRMR